MLFLEKYPELHLLLQIGDTTQDCVNKHEWDETFFLSQIDSAKTQIIYVIGLAQGKPFISLKQWLEQDKKRHLIFLESHLSAFNQLAELKVGEQMIEHPRVHLRFLPPLYDAVLEECAKEFPFQNVEVLKAFKGDRKASSIKLSLLRKTILWNGVMAESLWGHLLHQHIFENFKKIPSSFYINRSKGCFKGTPIVICGAGPSLNKIASELKRLKRKAIILGCGSALSALSYMQVKPHLGIAIDPNELEKVCLQGCQYSDLPLIYGARLYPGVFELFQGPLGFLSTPSATLLEKHLEKKIGLNEEEIGADLGREALSVTTLAVSLAHFWGCSPIILAGVDLAYEGDRYYAQGVPSQMQKNAKQTDPLIFRKGVEGKRVTTLVKWVMEQQVLEQYAQQHSETTFINLTGRGLGFDTIPYQTMDKIESMLPDREDIDHKIEKLIFNHSSTISLHQVEHVIGKLKKSFLKSLSLIGELSQLTPDSGLYALYELELANTDVYELVLKSCLQSIEKHFFLEGKDLTPKNKWAFLEEIIQYYLKFLP